MQVIRCASQAFSAEVMSSCRPPIVNVQLESGDSKVHSSETDTVGVFPLNETTVLAAFWARTSFTAMKKVALLL